MTETVVASGMSPAIVALFIFVLACFIGYYVFWGVTPSLHTPLISLTNAISGIIIVGAIWLRVRKMQLHSSKHWALLPCCWLR